MRKLFAILASVGLSYNPAVSAQVDPAIHKLCIEAKDYAGCVKAMTGETSAETTVRQIQQQGANLNEGNSCPKGFAYSGGGYCQRVVCMKRGVFGKGHDQYLGGIGYSCNGGRELAWDTDSQPIRATIDNGCPPNGFEIGFSSTCHQAEHKGYIDLIGFGYNVDKASGEIVDLFDEPAKGSGLLIGDKMISRRIRGLSEEETTQKIKRGIEIGDVMVLVIERNGRRKEFVLNAAPNRFPLPKTD